MNFHSLVDRVGLAAVELFDELLFHLLHEERLARLRYGERGLYFVSAAEGDDAAARDKQWLHDVVVFKGYRYVAHTKALSRCGRQPIWAVAVWHRDARRAIGRSGS